MAHYIGVFVPLDAGGWRGLFPDVPACEADGASLDLAVSHAASALMQHVSALNGHADEPALPRDLTAIKDDTEWASAHAIDWSTAVVTMIRLSQ
jgi:predicted RNase H-like HicB family nuclease